MEHLDTVVIGAGHAGLAMSHCLTARGIAHVVLERGRLAERWRSARWDSFRLLTPNWMSRLPGWEYAGDAPDGFLDAPGLVAHLAAYAGSFDAPVRERTTVIGVRPAGGGYLAGGGYPAGGGYLVETDQGDWRAPHVVIATGYYSSAVRPAGAAALPTAVAQVSPAGYRNPSRLPAGAVLVVGASASGIQIADELARAGREVVLSVGSHTRLPRRYRGHDILWWLERLGSLDRRLDELPDPAAAQREPSLQLVGGARLDLAVLRDRGVRLAGRLREVAGDTLRFADDLAGTVGAAQARWDRIRSRIDRYAAAALPPLPPDAPLPPVGPAPALRSVRLRRAGISTVVWATGLRPWYPWLHVDVRGADGRLRHHRGRTAAPGLHAIGLRFQHRRNATFIDGARHDAAYLADHIAARLRHRDRVPR